MRSKVDKTKHSAETIYSLLNICVVVVCFTVMSKNLMAARLFETSFDIPGGVAYHVVPNLNSQGIINRKADVIVFVSGFSFNSGALVGQAEKPYRSEIDLLDSLKFGHELPGEMTIPGKPIYRYENLGEGEWVSELVGYTDPTTAPDWGPGFDTRQGYLHELADIHGYDIYIIEYLDPTKSIQGNAAILERFLSTTMQERNKARQSKAIVFGYSMGGLVARYALTKMEHEHKNHYTKAYISYDSPHQGAYLPTAIEIFLRTLDDSLNKWPFSKLGTGEARRMTAEGLRLYSSPAVQQMLAMWVGKRADDGARTRIVEMFDNMSTKAAHPLYYAFRQELKAMGDYPKRLRKVAFSNGNINANIWRSVNRPSGKQILDFKAYLALKTGNDTILRARIYDEPWNFVSTLFKQTFVSDTDRVENVRMGVNGGMRKYGSSPGSYTMLIPRVSFTLENMPNRSAIHFSTPKIDQSNDPDYEVAQERRTFIPTKSALDLPVASLYYLQSQVPLSPFDATYRNPTAENLSHDQITREMAQFLENEIINLSTRLSFEAKVTSVIANL